MKYTYAIALIMSCLVPTVAQSMKEVNNPTAKLIREVRAQNKANAEADKEIVRLKREISAASREQNEANAEADKEIVRLKREISAATLKNKLQEFRRRIAKHEGDYRINTLEVLDQVISRLVATSEASDIASFQFNDLLPTKPDLAAWIEQAAQACDNDASSYGPLSTGRYDSLSECEGEEK